MSERALFRPLVRGGYDLQNLRIQTGNRLVANYRAKLGLTSEVKLETEDEAEAEAADPVKKASSREAERILSELKEAYGRLTDGIVSSRGKLGSVRTVATFTGNEVIGSYAELALIDQYIMVEDAERKAFQQIELLLTQNRLWNGWLKGVKGIGPMMAGVLLSEIDITRARYPSSLWKLAGLDVGPDGRGRSKRAEHLIDVQYTNRQGQPDTRKSITFNPFLKTKIMGVMAGVFVRCGSQPYRTIYDDYKHRLLNHATYSETRPGHRDMMAKRYMMKMFLRDLYREWRTIEGLPVAPPYEVAKLGRVHGQGPA